MTNGGDDEGNGMGWISAGFIFGMIFIGLLIFSLESCADHNQKVLDQHEAVKEGHAHYEATPEGASVFKWNVRCSK